MPRKPKKSKESDIDDEIIIGYSSKKRLDNPPKKAKSTKGQQGKSKTKKKQQKKKKRKNNIKKLLKVLLKLIVIIGIGTAIILFLFVSPVFNISQITVIGAKEITSSVYIAMSGIEIGQNIFGIDKASAVDEILKEPYVESIEINTKFPNKIEINVKERKASYITESNGRYFYLDKNGYILETSLSPLDLPQIKGVSSNLEIIEIGRKNRRKRT